ncbi:MAG TPA: orotidine-5'-phosphate decarboxylase [Stackebrandtia sp.]|jgi:orotidine-5'-phosphate decarboxylase|uniref:orotidine-5'-phosphate decarboxylase n=1 Tax=Stackebrandtia sp. TaxID=2023065 RepID=UPI002D29F263|nr:orotidine-5'-phosphate decarboxylase [Stackebrandtia sp.]HZE39828.1 orotidine-5'-phosphate decarboxylase [Stackebrandtia sp.]
MGIDAPFGARAAKALAKRGPLCVGIDPHSQLLRAWGLDDTVAGAERFAMTMVEALAGQVAFIKPQSAFFERFGSAGIALLERVIAAARHGGSLVIVDAKRGDIGSTAYAYAQAYLDPSSPLAGDAVTASPFLGVGSLRPMFDMAAAHHRGVFVLALTSNPEGVQVQRARRKDGRTVAQSIIDEIGDANADTEPMGSLGVVVGATVGAARGEQDSRGYGVTHSAVQTGETAHDLSALNGPILVPGMGTQGGKPEDLRRVLGTAASQAIPSYSREIARHGPSAPGLRQAASQAGDQCRQQLGR